MEEKNRSIKNINFAPFKLREFKAENFAINTNHSPQSHRSSMSCINKINNYSIVVRNPTDNALYDKIDISNLSKAKSLLNSSIQNETLSNTNNNIIYHNNYTYQNSQSVDCVQKKHYKPAKFGEYNYTDNLLNSQGYKYYYQNIDKKKIPYKFKNKNTIFSQNQFYDKYKENLENKNIPSITIFFENKKNNYNRNKFTKNRVGNKKYYCLLDKVILIQSSWRSYFLRKLVVSGLEKYYSSLALHKYFDNIIYNNKKKLFNYFIEAMNDFIIKKQITCFSYKKSKNYIKKFFKDYEESYSSFGISNDKKEDCIYFFIKKEQNKNKENKYGIKNNIKNKNLKKDKEKEININEYNCINSNKKRNNNCILTSLYKKNSYCLKNENKNKNNNIKVNLYKKMENDNKNNNNNNRRCLSNVIPDISKLIHKKNKNNKRIIVERNSKRIYVRKKALEENRSNKLMKEMISHIINKSDLINKNKSKKLIILTNFINTIKNKYLNVFYHLLINLLNFQIKKNIVKNYFLNIFQNINKKILEKYYRIFKNNLILKKIDENEKINEIYLSNSVPYSPCSNSRLRNKNFGINEIHKIKVNKNNQIEKNKKIKILKKIIEKKIIKENKINAIYLTKNFLKWNALHKKTLTVQFNSNENLKKLNNKKPKSFTKKISKDNSSKKHIRVKIKKLLTSNDSIISRSSDRKMMSSLSSKKMRVFKKISYDNNFSTLVSYNNDKSSKDLFSQYNKNESAFINKISSLINKLEIKNIMYKYFHYWKKESKNKVFN